MSQVNNTGNNSWSQTRANRRKDQPTVHDQVTKEFGDLSNVRDKGRKYTIQSGDTLDDIGLSLKANNSKYKDKKLSDITKELQNKWGISNPTRLQAGKTYDMNNMVDDKRNVFKQVGQWFGDLF